jgi:hypothetical protein
MHQNIRLGSNGVDRVRSLREIPMRLRGTNFCTSLARFAPSFVRQKIVPNAPKWYEMNHNVSVGSNGLDRERSLQKIKTRLRGTKFFTSSARFPQSFVRQPNGPECSQNGTKHTKLSVYSQMGWIRRIRCEKLR